MKTKPVIRAIGAALAGLVVVCGLSACENADATYAYKEKGDENPRFERLGEERKKDSIFGEDGLTLFGGADDAKVESGGSGIAVNAYLWRAALDTISFMPMSNADPFGGTILTDWYTPPETPSERMKVNVVIMSKALRADGVRVSVFRQVQNQSAGWVDQAVDPQVNTELENTILTRARELRMTGRTE